MPVSIKLEMSSTVPSLVQYGNLLQFADNTTLICCGDTCEEVQRQLAHDLELASKWISFSKMWLNINKLSAMLFFSKHSKCRSQYPPIVLGNQSLKVVTQQHYLGIRNFRLFSVVGCSCV